MHFDYVHMIFPRASSCTNITVLLHVMILSAKWTLHIRCFLHFFIASRQTQIQLAAIKPITIKCHGISIYHSFILYTDSLFYTALYVFTDIMNIRLLYFWGHIFWLWFDISVNIEIRYVHVKEQRSLIWCPEGSV